MVIANGTIIDGTVRPRIVGNIRIRNGKISDVGPFKPAPGETVLDVKGLIVAPGFVDLSNGSSAVSQVGEGITTAVLGASGVGPYAVEDSMLHFDEKPPAMNIATFVGHATVRLQIMGPDYKRAAKPDEIQLMGELAESAMREGAFGLSVNLQNELESYATKDELIAVAKAMARYGGTLSIRVRNETDKALDSIREAIEIGRAAKVPVQISHIKTVQGLAEIDKARMQAIDVAADTPALMDEKDVRTFLQHAWVMFASDGGPGVFPSIIGQYVQKTKLLTLEQAIRKMTALPASRVGLRERGVLAKGSAADVVIFDAATAGAVMKYVFVNGAMVIKDGQPIGENSGQALR